MRIIIINNHYNRAESAARVTGTIFRVCVYGGGGFLSDQNCTLSKNIRTTPYVYIAMRYRQRFLSDPNLVIVGFANVIISNTVKQRFRTT